MERWSHVDLVAACREASRRFRAGEPTPTTAGADPGDPCFELFRRAIATRDDRAWEAVMQQYGAMVLAWVRRHPASATLPFDDRDQDWVTTAFERFWNALAPNPTRAGQFGSLAALLRYLKLCVHSALLDAVRANPPAPTVPLSAAEDVAADPGDQVAASDLWQAITDELPDDAERLIARLSFVLDLKPAEIHERFPDRFPNTADVYRIKRNVLERLRRSEAILALAGRRTSEATR